MGPFERAEARLHLHPDVMLSRAGPRALRLHLDGCSLELVVEGAALHLAESTWHPGFNRSVPNRAVIASFEGARARCRLELA